MNTIRTLLEQIKQFDDKRREGQNGPAEDAMILYPPAAPEAIQKFVEGGWSHPLPSSYGDFLAASDGVTKFRGQLDFVGTDIDRQNAIRTIVAGKIQQDKINLRAMFKTVDDTVIAQREADPNKFYVANHPVIAVSKRGSLLFYDMRTRDAQGEMQLCWRSAIKATIEKRYTNLEQYLETALQEAKEKAGA